MSEPTEHHIVSRFYLRGFCDQELPHKFWVYRRGNPYPKHGSPKKTARLLQYNAFEMEDGKLDSATVETLLNIIETPASQIWERLHDRSYSIADEERMVVAEFIALAAARVPSVREALNDILDKDIRAVMEWQAAHFDELSESERLSYGMSTREDLDEVISTGKQVRFSLDQNSHIDSMIHALPELASVIFHMKWKFLHAPEGSVFVTSDNPVVRINPNNPTDFKGQDGFELPRIQVTFPINAKLMLLLMWEGSTGHMEITEKLVNEFNQRTAAFALHEVYSPRRITWLDEYFANQVASS